ncbi:glyoxylate reductase [Hortaea werneckii]|uniref:D-isomer specific 2-hydroxyacid dehydrogenase NAD-binding domain-containing protein n=1 Tax=Hortaea werneckii TaxID=91943 RepID=A0A3M7FK18_HORWE|nr:glyoxylate reductase [Hortaea werneckii]KAI6888071.1 glyoxylate reductase [Hortaea werneckii]KAI7001521.1 glyoxylate reductase [Hortaea werneckii]KAI7149507.1 glyoxylate reductase [Hortaea werneckii]KAI7177678.1 glyoxylate reductase [Hortaea werneckii]
MAKPKVLLLGKIDHATQTWENLSDIAELIQPQSTNRADFIAECKSGGLDGVAACYRTFASASITGPWDEELIAALPRSLLWCSHNGAGYDQIDVAACSARDPPLRVANVPVVPDDATADTAVFLILGALRGFNTSLFAAREGKWRGQPPPPLGHDPQGKTLGILGMGGIGRNMMRKCEAFGMKAIYHNRKKLSEEMAGGAEYVGFEELLARSDVLSLNLPLNKNTRHIISTPEFTKMKRGIVIINTARGAVMDESALVSALESGQVASAGLDVYEEEPKIHEGLLKNPHVMLLPHMGTWSQETQEEMEKWCIGNIRAGLETGKLKSPVPEQADL